MSLKAANTSEIEVAIAKALADVTGSKYAVQLSEITFGTTEQDEYLDKARIRLQVSRVPEKPKYIGDVVEEVRALMAEEDNEKPKIIPDGKVRIKPSSSNRGGFRSRRSQRAPA